MCAFARRSGTSPAALLLLCASATACHGSGGAGAARDGGADAADAVGIAECDDYLSKYETCVSHASVDRRKPLRDSFERTRASWKTLAANPGARPGLPQMCRMTLEMARTTMKQYDCQG